MDNIQDQQKDSECPDKAKEAVFVQSVCMPEGTPIVKGKVFFFFGTIKHPRQTTR